MAEEKKEVKVKSDRQKAKERTLFYINKMSNKAKAKRLAERLLRTK